MVNQNNDNNKFVPKAEYYLSYLTWENSPHFATPPREMTSELLLLLRNERRNSILMTRHYRQIWVVLLICWRNILANQRPYPDLGSDASSVWNFCAGLSTTVTWLRRHFAGTPASGGVETFRFFSQLKLISDCIFLWEITMIFVSHFSIIPWTSFRRPMIFPICFSHFLRSWSAVFISCFTLFVRHGQWAV